MGATAVLSDVFDFPHSDRHWDKQYTDYPFILEADQHIASGAIDQAVSSLIPFLQSHPDLSLTYLRIARAHMAMNRIEKARTTLQLGLSKVILPSHLCDALGDLEQGQGEYGAAVAWWNCAALAQLRGPRRRGPRSFLCLAGIADALVADDSGDWLRDRAAETEHGIVTLDGEGQPEMHDIARFLQENGLAPDVARILRALRDTDLGEPAEDFRDPLWSVLYAEWDRMMERLDEVPVPPAHAEVYWTESMDWKTFAGEDGEAYAIVVRSRLWEPFPDGTRG